MALCIGKSGSERAEYSRSPYRERPPITGLFRCLELFQSTLPIQGATEEEAIEFIDISIHAPHTGSDGTGDNLFRSLLYFNPRSPYRERLYLKSKLQLTAKFQSTLPIQGATPMLRLTELLMIFQSTLPIQGATFYEGDKVINKIFQSTLPIQGATLLCFFVII